MQCTCAILSSVTWPALQYFSTLSHERHDFRVTENIEHKMCVVIFSTFFWNTFHSMENRARYDQKCILFFMLCNLQSRTISMKFEFYRQIFEKSSKNKFNENPSSLRQVIPCGRKEGQTDRQDEANSHFFAILRTRLRNRFPCLQYKSRLVKCFFFPCGAAAQRGP